MYISVDIETDGPNPGDYSMLSMGAVVVEPGLTKTFYRELSPITKNYNPESVKHCGFTREQTWGFDNPLHVMKDFKDWLDKVKEEKQDKRITFIADNAGFDWSFVNWYFHHFIGDNPFGYSGGSLTWMFKGIVKDDSKSFKHLRKTKHTHNALDDAVGNAEAILEIIKQYDIKMKL